MNTTLAPHPLLNELQTRWRDMFAALAAGDDLPPGPRLRTEGMMEAALLQQLATEEELLDAMQHCYQAAFGRSLAEEFGADWRDFYPFPQIPAMAARAPVFPSTAD
jgi:hypothetical protein